jgi:hypothetical protein
MGGVRYVRDRILKRLRGGGGWQVVAFFSLWLHSIGNCTFLFIWKVTYLYLASHADPVETTADVGGKAFPARQADVGVVEERPIPAHLLH